MPHIAKHTFISRGRRWPIALYNFQDITCQKGALLIGSFQAPLEWLVGLIQFYKSDLINFVYGKKSLSGPVPQTFPMCASLNMLLLW